jgi:hypothetical protein
MILRFHGSTKSGQPVRVTVVFHVVTEEAAPLEPGLRSWIDNVIVPVLVRGHLRSKALHSGLGNGK